MRWALVTGVLLGLWSAVGAAEVVRRSVDPRLVEAQEAFNEGHRLMQAGEDARAQPLVERAIQLREEALGVDHLDVAAAINLLGLLHSRQGQVERAEFCYLHALKNVERALGKSHPSVATLLNNLGVLYAEQGLAEKARPVHERALAIREAKLGKDDPQLAESLFNLATFYFKQGQYARAEPLYARALASRQAVLGENHPEVAELLNLLGILHFKQGQYARAEPLYARALTIWQATLGDSHPQVADALNNLGVLHVEQGQYARAEPLLTRALAIRQAALGENHPQVAEVLNLLGHLHTRQGQYARAEPLYERARALLEEALGENHPQVADSLNGLGALFLEQGQYARAESLYGRALVILEEAFGRNHPRMATPLSSLAYLHGKQGQYDRAMLMQESVLAIQQAAFGENHPQVAETLNHLGLLHAEQGQYAQAEPLYERALAIRQAALGENDVEVATFLNNLATLYVYQAQYARAEPLLKRALAIHQAAFGESHPEVADSLNGLGILYVDQEQYARAEPLLKRALAIRQEVLGQAHPDVASSFHKLASLYLYQRQYARAEPLLQRALALQDAALGKDHPNTVLVLNALATLYMNQGQVARAAPLYERALAILGGPLGKSPRVVPVLNNLAMVRLEQEKHAEGLTLYAQAFALSELHLRREALVSSESRLTSILHLLRVDEERLYALASANPDHAELRQLALTSALLRKGRSVEELASTSRIISRGLSPADREKFEQLRGLRTQLSTLSLAGPGQGSAADHSKRLKALAEQGDALERDLARRSAALRALRALPPPAELVGQVAAALPQDSALVEFITYRPNATRPTSSVPGARKDSEVRYLALLLFPDGRTHALDLGPSAPIDQAAKTLHQALTERAVAYQPAAEALHALVFRPLVPLLGTVRHLFLSPDGQLSLVPFAALHDGSRFLVEDWDFTYLTSGKDLLRRSERNASASAVVVLADPDFSAPTAASAEAEPAPLPQRSESLLEFFSTLRAGGGSQRWKQLPGTREEAEAIQRLLPQAKLLLGGAATKEALLKVETPGVLHIATHGFFLEDASAGEGTRAAFKPSLVNSDRPQKAPDPLLRSGLVLAGAQVPQAGGPSRPEDSLVTALELAGMDLWGTQLVVLSACETGRGDVKLGQGVYGLRRALVVAGAETVVTSLWSVNDKTTRELMEGYYRQLLAGQGRATALREAMKALRKEKPHPYYWAPFIAIGQDAPLRGLVPLQE
jgi:tetratricopeptide (TPR) repeat protein